MEFEFEQLESWPVRSSEQQEKKIWQPSWKCFCCQDTGKIQPDLVRLVIPDYDDDRDKRSLTAKAVSPSNMSELQQRSAKLGAP